MLLAWWSDSERDDVASMHNCSLLPSSYSIPLTHTNKQLQHQCKFLVLLSRVTLPQAHGAQHNVQYTMLQLAWAKYTDLNIFQSTTPGFHTLSVLTFWSSSCVPFSFFFYFQIYYFTIIISYLKLFIFIFFISFILSKNNYLFLIIIHFS